MFLILQADPGNKTSETKRSIEPIIYNQIQRKTPLSSKCKQHKKYRSSITQMLQAMERDSQIEIHLKFKMEVSSEILKNNMLLLTLYLEINVRKKVHKRNPTLQFWYP